MSALHIQKVAILVKEKIKKNHENWLTNQKVFKSQKMPKQLKIFSLTLRIPGDP